MSRPTLAERFWANVETGDPDDCWPWLGALKSGGYGRIWNGGRTQSVHRLSYELSVGPIPAGMVIDHTCHERDPGCSGPACPHRRCVNPGHLQVTTPEDNQRRGHHAAAWRKRPERTHCPAGHEYTPESTFGEGDKRRCRTCLDGARLLVRNYEGPWGVETDRVPSKGDTIVIPRGAFITGTHPALPKAAQRTYRVKVEWFSEHDGVATWAGAGGYWHRTIEWCWPDQYVPHMVRRRDITDGSEVA